MFISPPIQSLTLRCLKSFTDDFNNVKLSEMHSEYCNLYLNRVIECLEKVVYFIHVCHWLVQEGKGGGSYHFGNKALRWGIAALLYTMTL